MTESAITPLTDRPKSSDSELRFEPGQHVFVRQRRYQVDQVISTANSQKTVLRLSCVDPDNLGRTLEVVWEAELDRRIVPTETWGTIGSGSFDPPDLFSAYYHSIRWNRMTAGRDDLVQAPFRAGISLEHYQIEPLRMALKMPRVNLFIADGVGLGKTIEAGLIARELLLRRKVSDILVCCPPSMILQWQEEMESKFGLTFQIIDRDYVRKIRRERGFNVNPWATHSRFIVSHNLIKDEEYAFDLRAWLGTDLLRPRSLLILDEAHHAAPATSSAYAISSQFTRRIQEVAPRFEHKLFLSATPHNGHTNSFSMLMSILDPQRFCPGVTVRPAERDQVLIYRLKDDLRKLNIAFPVRKVEPIVIDAPAKGTPELELAEMLDLYCSLREDRLRSQPARIKNASAFLKSGLQQRLLSSVEAFWRTLSKHQQTVQRLLEQPATLSPGNDLDETALAAIGAGSPDYDDDPLSENDGFTITDDSISAESPSVSAIDAEAEKQTMLATVATMASEDDPRFRQEIDTLERMAKIASAARLLPDEKIKAMFAYIDKNMLQPAATSGSPRGWTDHRLIIFTEYDDTLTYIRKMLDNYVRDTAEADARIAVYRGGTSLEMRQQVKEAFNAHPANSPVRILLATDAAREGLNLQYHCHNLFHFDIPWNPARLEQRNGRIDRKLQPQPVIYCRYFEYANRAEDRILRTIVEKTDKIYRELGGFGKVLDRKAFDRLRKKGIDRAAIPELKLVFDDEAEDSAAGTLAAQALLEVCGDVEETPPASPATPAAATPAKRPTSHEAIDNRRQDRLMKSVEQCRALLEKSKSWLDCRADQFRAAIDCSLRLMDIEYGLQPESFERPRARRYHLPLERLEKRPDWRETVDLLRARRKKGESYAEWARRCPVRPVVFEDPIQAEADLANSKHSLSGHAVTEDPATKDPVHLHLEHRIVQRLLGRFQAQGFAAHDISRACLAQTAGSTPLVFLIARHCLYGDHASRLHEDLIIVCAEYALPDRRTQPLQPIPPTILSEDAWMQRLDAALLHAAAPRVPESLSRSILHSVQRDIDELKSAIAQKANQAEAAIKDSLEKIAAEESAKTRKLLEDLRDRITRELAARQNDEPRPSKAAATRPGEAMLIDVAGNLSEEERLRQRERASEIRLMQKRLEQLATEIEEEPRRIIDRYRVVNPRVEPVGIVYLWPEQG